MADAPAMLMLQVEGGGRWEVGTRALHRTGQSELGCCEENSGVRIAGKVLDYLTNRYL